MTCENQDKKFKMRPVLKNEFVSRYDLKIMMKRPSFFNTQKNAIRLLESIESLKEGKIIETSLSELPHK